MSEVIRKNNGKGYYDDKRKLICMIRCFECGRENLVQNLIQGDCAWCGHNPNEKKIER